ncbi:hypothetical protein HMPREF9446_00848 [Bacteroides fluxus YIT 12057]|uniref:Uncharacterized protein n=1 Tax=Bacteroides fluxus YIT 12057 TaxID=763034 RepID=F3PQ56_9BACE|nr:hypothetical protein HMPREF9446_00848 [Bacteroides fluxus YIT 12057]
MMSLPLSINNPLSPRTKRIHYLLIWHVECWYVFACAKVDSLSIRGD